LIDRLEVRNIKTFQSASIRLAPLTLLSGVNAVGKSTVFQALAVLRQSFDAGLLRPDGGLLLNGDYVELGTGADLLHDDFTPDEHGRPFVEVSVTEEDSIGTWRATVMGAAERAADLLTWDHCDPAAVGCSLFGDGFQYLRADRVSPAVTYPRSYDVAVRRRFLGSHGEHTVNFLRVHRDSSIPAALRHPGTASSSLMDQTEAWLQDLCPGVNLDADGISGADLVQLSYGFFGRAGLSSSQIRYRPTNVGFGLTYALPLLVACLSARSDSLILLENPEAHLHPRGQSAMAQLVALAAASGAQVIVETHSDHFLNGVRLAVKTGTIPGSLTAVHYFDRDVVPPEPNKIPPVRIESPIIGDDGMLSIWPAGFFDEWEHALDRLLEDGDS
jgi:predicted ATPase